ncbi:XRE family transcriptional regulator [Lactobacillus johnsonii]|uniref:helix-turn-helix domain-containing protein n=1 Tax=Lactobacillus johnsonii TaxID=33959 RepID=UPI000E330EBF|nr:helix-turn-helix transcriptional regulator [Lactobacillus johnsonii]AXQ19272.1 XRE family transcriptional regulator [Lactobacillus johnsonii]
MKNRIKELRKDKKLTLVELSKKVQIPNNTLSQYENEKRKPKLETWQALANFFNVSVEYLKGYLIAECRWCGNKFVLTSDKDKDRYFYCPYCGRSPLTFKTK